MQLNIVIGQTRRESGYALCPTLVEIRSRQRAVITADALSVERDVGSMCARLQRNVRHQEVSWTECRDAVWDVLTRRTTDADLQRSFSRVAHVDCSHTFTLNVSNSYRPIRRLRSLVLKGVGLATRDSIPSHSTTSSAMDDRRRAGKPPQYFTMQLRPTQLPTLSRTGNEYPPKCGDALRLGSKGRYGSFHLWISVWVAGKTVWSLVNTCHTWAP